MKVSCKHTITFNLNGVTKCANCMGAVKCEHIHFTITNSTKVCDACDEIIPDPYVNIQDIVGSGGSCTENVLSVPRNMVKSIGTEYVLGLKPKVLNKAYDLYSGVHTTLKADTDGYNLKAMWVLCLYRAHILMDDPVTRKNLLVLYGISKNVLNKAKRPFGVIYPNYRYTNSSDLVSSVCVCLGINELIGGVENIMVIEKVLKLCEKVCVKIISGRMRTMASMIIYAFIFYMFPRIGEKLLTAASKKTTVFNKKGWWLEAVGISMDTSKKHAVIYCNTFLIPLLSTTRSLNE